MKIRNGFVSNSSSSSFVLLGKRYDEINNDNLLDIAKKLNVLDEYLEKIKNYDIDSADEDEMCEKVDKLSGLVKFSIVTDYEAEVMYVGKEFNYIKDIIDFTQEDYNKIEEIFGKATYFNDTIYG